MQIIGNIAQLCIFVPATLSLTLNELFPFGNEAGDRELKGIDDGSSPKLVLSTPFPYFNQRNPSLFVNVNGIISFQKAIQGYTTTPFPIGDGVGTIAPFWADIDTTYTGTIWYRELINPTLLERVSEEVRGSFSQFYRFRASWIFIVTWERVPFFGCYSSPCSKTNTFQSILISDGQHSFVIFNYEQIQWGGTEEQVGFNSGDGVTYYMLNDIVNVDKMSNVGIPGKFVFRVDSSIITTGKCNTEGNLTISPGHGPMLGGQYLVLSGTCIEDSANITATFQGSRKYRCERKSKFSMVCITPVFNCTGEIVIRIEIENQGVTNFFHGLYTVVNPANSKQRVFRENYPEWFIGQQSISWDPYVVELEQNDTVDIYLFSLVVDNNRHLTWKSQILQRGIQRSLGSATVLLQTSDSALAIRVTSAAQSYDQPDRGIWSDIFPLALPPDQAQKLCNVWLKNETQLPQLPTNDVQPCPCTLGQALLDIVRFQPDPDCNMLTRPSVFSRTGNCVNRKEAKHCVRFLNLGPDGIDNLCCYDVTNNLMVSREKEGGSLQRYHYVGGQNTQPYITHFYFDVLPFLHCCRYSPNVYKDNKCNDSNMCSSYFKHRQRSSCFNYVPPQPAQIKGDPHITTFDGFKYTFNGVGEFMLSKTVDGSFQSQVRFEQFREENGNLISASRCTALAAQDLYSSVVVEVLLNSIRIADVLVNGNRIDFNETNHRQVEGVTVLQFTTNSISVNGTNKEFIIAFTSFGISFKAIASSNMLNILPVIGNSSLFGNLRGLLGDYDKDSSNDLKPPTLEILHSNSTSEQIYDGFGNKWRIAENESLFTYGPWKTYNDYQKLSFRPTFDLPANISAEVKELCTGDKECEFDYVVTRSAEFGAETWRFSVLYNSSIQASYEIRTCDSLPVISGGFWNSSQTIQVEGSIAIFSCIPGYEPQGDNYSTTCRNGSWSAFGHFSCRK
ncbi:protein mesh-like [Saccostrea cucullata]|uniref:protein mesh-like n=1 Tax=Saccostrea cuccullata TaxID=36930 RepID=UPI002ED00FFB